MAEYIEREAVMQAFSDFVWNSNHSDLVPAPTWNHAVDIVRDIPAADVVEVVRCWECKFAEYIGPMDYICRRKGGCFHGMEFCSYGERKMDGGVNRIEIDTVKNGGVNDA